MNEEHILSRFIILSSICCTKWIYLRIIWSMRGWQILFISIIPSSLSSCKNVILIIEIFHFNLNRIEIGIWIMKICMTSKQNSWICEYLIFAKNSKICVSYINMRDWVSIIWWRILNNRLFNFLDEMNCRFYCVIIFCLHRESKKLISKKRVDNEKMFF